jgi:zinc protease
MATACACVALACGPKPGPEEPEKERQEEPDVEANVSFLETMSIPPEVLAAIEAQRQKVVEQPDPLGEEEFSFPKVHEGKLGNGLKWYVVEREGLPLVSLNLVVRAGMAHDPEELQGLSVFTGDMLREGGSKKRPAAELSEEIETLGAELSIITGADYTLAAVDSLSEHAGALLDLLAELTLEPAFGEDEMERFRKREMHRLELSRSDPEWIADFVFLEKLYGDHPYSRYDTTKEALEAMTREDVIAFHETHYAARNAFFVAVGDVDRGKLAKMLEKSFGKMPKGKPVKIKWPKIPEPEKRRVVIVHRPESAQTVIRVGNNTLVGRHDDALPFLVTNHVLGGNASSRLFMVLREEKGLTYGCYSHAPMRVDVGAFFVETSTKTASTGESLEEIFNQMEAFLDGVSEDELEANQSYLTGVLAIKAQTPSRIADMLIDRIVYDLPRDYYDTYQKKVEAVTPEILDKLAERYIRPDTALVVLVGDGQQFQKDVERWGEVEVVKW